MPTPTAAPAAPARGVAAIPDAGALAVILPLLVGAAVLPLVPWYADLEVAAIILSAAHVLLCCWGAALAVYRGLRPCLLVASVFPYCWLAMPAVYQIAHGEAAWGDPGVTLDTGATLTALGILVVGQAALLAGYLLLPGRDGVRETPWLSSAGRVRLVLFASALLLALVALLPMIISAAGGIGAFFTSREALNDALESSGAESASPMGAVLKIVPAALATVAALLGIHLFRSRRGRGDVATRAAVLVVVAAVALMCLVANPFSSTRFLFLVSFGPLALVVLRPYHRPAAVAWLGAFLFAFLLAYPLADMFRRSSSTVESSPAELLASKDFDGFQQAVNTVTYVDVEGISHGTHLLSGLLFFVPRSIWPAKEIPASITIAEERGYVFTNLSLPFPAEAYLNGSWFGVVVVLAVVGALFVALDRAWRSGSHWSLLTAFVAMAQVGLWRGPFGSLVPVFGFAGALLVLALLLAHGRSRREEPGPGPGGGQPVASDSRWP